MELPSILETPEEERLQRVDALGVLAAFVWSDVATDIEANDAARRLYAEAISRIVHDPQTAADLVPHYPIGCKRIIIDQGYFPTFNEPHVRLVNLRRTPIERVVPDGIELVGGERLELDAIVYATGFDAMTGALSRIDVRGRGGRSLAEEWAGSPKAYLGVAVAGFPNLFTVTGPGSPSVLTNMVTSIEQHVEWIADCIGAVTAQGHRTIEPDPAAADGYRGFVLDGS
jgi:cation diffusion facilitator CzcD-associated flavoprotein CzcO